MGTRRYTDVQLMWIENNITAKVWRDRHQFREEFNKTFNTNVTQYQLNNLLLYYGWTVLTEQTQSIFTDEQKEWLIKNAKSGIFKNCKELTKVYNAIFKQKRDYKNIYSYLHNWGISLNTGFNQTKYTDDMDAWLINNFDKYDTYEDLVKAFNEVFIVEKTVPAIAHRCTRTLKLKRPCARFTVGHTRTNSKKVGDISYRSDCRWIKVSNDNDRLSWMPLYKKVWIDAFGNIPDGCCIIALDGNKDNVSLDNLCCVDRRGTAIMAKFHWFTDNKVITSTGAQWCNLYLTAKDNGVYAETDQILQ